MTLRTRRQNLTNRNGNRTMAIKKDPEIERMTQEIARGSSSAVSTKVFDEPLPDFVQGDEAGAGLGRISPDSVEKPFLVLTQALSPQADSGDARPGEWWLTAAEENLGRTVRLVPCRRSESLILFRPRSAGGGILARAPDLLHWDPPETVFEVQLNGRSVTYDTSTSVAKSGLTRFGTEDPSAGAGSPPAATAFINYLCYLPDYPGRSPVIVAFSKSAYKVGRRLTNQLIDATKKTPRRPNGAPLFSCLLELSAVKEDGAKGSYWLPSFRGLGRVTDPEHYTNAKSIYQHYEDRDIDASLREDVVPNGHEDSADY
jgi:hypothetical protein